MNSAALSWSAGLDWAVAWVGSQARATTANTASSLANLHMRDPNSDTERKQQSKPSAWRDNGTIYGANGAAKARRICVRAQIKAILAISEPSRRKPISFRVHSWLREKEEVQVAACLACGRGFGPDLSAPPRFTPPMPKRLPRPPPRRRPLIGPMPSCKTPGTSRPWSGWSDEFPVVSAGLGSRGNTDPQYSSQQATTCGAVHRCTNCSSSATIDGA